MRKVTNTNLIYRNIWGTKWNGIEEVIRVLVDKSETTDKEHRELPVKKFEIHSPGKGKRTPSNHFIWEGDELEQNHNLRKKDVNIMSDGFEEAVVMTKQIG